MAQDSAYTSLNQVPAFFKSKTFGHLVSEHKITKILDVGGGKFDTATDFLSEKENIQNIVYDPYNRSEKHNLRAMKSFQQPVEEGYGKMVVCLNVLNVIHNDDELEATVAFCACNAMGCTVVFQIYEGSKSGRKTTKTVQRNQRTSAYVKTVQKFFKNVRVTRNLIIAS